MKKRILAVVIAMVALLAVVIGASASLRSSGLRSRVGLGQSDLLPPPPQKTFPRKYVGVVSYNVPSFDRTCGCWPNVAVHYLHIGGNMDIGVTRSILSTGAIPMLELEPYGSTLAKVVSGREDTWLAKYARAVSSLHSPVIMSFAPEANGNWYSWGYNHVAPNVIVSAWRHVVNVVREAGAHEVRWAWIMNVNFQGSENIGLLWPGNAYVNILGLDGYFVAPSTFQAVFGPTIVAMRAISSDPLLITETAAAPVMGKFDALSEIATGVAKYGLIGFIWFDIRQHGSIRRQDWRLGDDPAALALFRRDVQLVR